MPTHNDDQQLAPFPSLNSDSNPTPTTELQDSSLIPSSPNLQSHPLHHPDPHHNQPLESTHLSLLNLNLDPQPVLIQWSLEALNELSLSLANKTLHLSRKTLLSLTNNPNVNNATEVGKSVNGYDGSQFQRNSKSNSKSESDTEDPKTTVFYSSLPWLDRQLVAEWRSYAFGEKREVKTDQEEQPIVSESPTSTTSTSSTLENEQEYDSITDFASIKITSPPTLPSPKFANATSCHSCNLKFTATLFRHHCRACGNSFCNSHSYNFHPLPQYTGYGTVPERVCELCTSKFLKSEASERVQWRLCRLRDFTSRRLIPYFSTGRDTTNDLLWRIANGALAAARSIPLGAPAYIAVETIDVLRKHGLNGIYSLVLRKEFVQAAELLRKVAGLEKAWPMSVHELTAAIFYALAEMRRERGGEPDGEERGHALIQVEGSEVGIEESMKEEEEGEDLETKSVMDLLSQADVMIKKGEERWNTPFEPSPTASSTTPPSSLPSTKSKSKSTQPQPEPEPRFIPVCTPFTDPLLSLALFYAPLALHFIYLPSPLSMQLLSAQQGWNLLYCHIDQDQTSECIDRPVSALFVHRERRVAGFVVRGTVSVNDVVTDLRSTPVVFPDEEDRRTGEEEDSDADADVDNDVDNDDTENEKEKDAEWTSVEGANDAQSSSNPKRRPHKGIHKGIALCGMARSAAYLFKENIAVIASIVTQGYSIRFCGHSLGGGVASLLGILVRDYLIDKKLISFDDNEIVRVYGYGTPACIDSNLAHNTESYMLTVVLHEDCVPRISPTSIRKLMKHLLVIRKTWVESHMGKDIEAVKERVKGVWTPRWRESFVMKMKGRRKEEELEGGGEEVKSTTTTTSSNQHQHQQSLASIEEGEKKIESIAKDDYDDEVDDEDEDEEGGIEMDSKPPSNLRQSMFDSGKRFGYGNDGDSLNTTIDDDEGDEDGSEKDQVDGLTGSKHSHSSFPHSCSNPSHTVDGVVSIAKSNGGDIIESDVSAASCDVKEEEEEGEDSSSLSKEASSSFGSQQTTPSSSSEDADEDDPVILDETPLPHMYLPGSIAHIYSYRGVYKMVLVPRTFKDLRKISISSSLINDHTCKSYYEALLEVRSVRKAKVQPPVWTSFKSTRKCLCCHSSFTWSSTSNTEAQEAKDKHNCRACGGLVCGPCSEQRVALPEIGLEGGTRVCDGCYYDLGSRGEEVKVEGEEDVMKVKTNGDNVNADYSFSESGEAGGGGKDDFNKEAGLKVGGERRRPRSSVVKEIIKNLNDMNSNH